MSSIVTHGENTNSFWFSPNTGIRGIWLRYYNWQFQLTVVEFDLYDLTG